MLYTVAEVSDITGFSKVTIYNKIKTLKSDLKGCINVDKGVTYIDDKGLLIIKASLGLKVKENTLNDFKNEEDVKVENPDTDYNIGQFKDINNLIKTVKNTVETSQEKYINSLLSQIEFLKLELDKKDEKLNNTLRLLENSQILIKENKEKILELENQEQKNNRKSIFSWFKK